MHSSGHCAASNNWSALNTWRHVGVKLASLRGLWNLKMQMGSEYVAQVIKSNLQMADGP